MPKTGSHLRITEFGEEALGVTLQGNPAKPEPTYFRVNFPGGEVTVTRCDDGSYWVHVTVNHCEGTSFDPFKAEGRITDARLDIHGRHTSEVDCGEFDNPNLYHLAVRVRKTGG